MYRGLKNAVIVKDVLPKKWKHNDKASKQTLNHQINKLFKILEDNKLRLQTLRAEICCKLQDCLQKNDFSHINYFGINFLQVLMSDIKEHEEVLCTEVMGEQNCVEMYQEEKKTRNLPSHFVTAAIMNRNVVTQKLTEVVLHRETVFSCLEILRLSKNCPKFDTNNILPYCVIEYEKVKNSIKENLESIRQFNYLQKKFKN